MSPLTRLASTALVTASVPVLTVPVLPVPVTCPPTVPATSVAVRKAAPTDSYRSQQWTLGALRISRAWRHSRGDGVTVAVLDTGVDGFQPDLSGRVIDGPDYTGHTRKPGSRFWGRHGTSMASIIAGHGHGPGGNSGIMGVAPEAKILSIRVTWELNDPSRTDHAQVDGDRNAVAQGIRYAVDHGAQVISMSLGGGKLFYAGNPVEEEAIKYALARGVVLVASAGNDGAGPNRRNYPAAYPGVIAVGAVDRLFRPAKFTNRHTYVSVAAPGVEIVSADVSGHGYVLGTGTSASAAFVAGMSALIKARYPKLKPAEVDRALEEGATHRPPDGRNNRIGTGVADAYGALRAAARINRARHGGASVRAPGTSKAPDAPSADEGDDGTDLTLVAILVGGGTLIVLSLILGWRYRRRRQRAHEDDEDDAFLALHDRPPAAATAARPSAFDPAYERSARWFEPRPDPLGDVPMPPPTHSGSGGSRVVPGPMRPFEPSHEMLDRTNGNGNGAPGGFPACTEDFHLPWPSPVQDDLPAYPPPNGPSAQEPPPGELPPTVALPTTHPPAPITDDPEPGGTFDRPAPESGREAISPEDPLGGGPVEPSPDVGTPLADESWESIRRRLDRIKREAAADGPWEAPPRPARGPEDDTVNMPRVDPGDKDDQDP